MALQAHREGLGSELCGVAVFIGVPRRDLAQRDREVEVGQVAGRRAALRLKASDCLLAHHGLRWISDGGQQGGLSWERGKQEDRRGQLVRSTLGPLHPDDKLQKTQSEGQGVRE